MTWTATAKTGGPEPRNGHTLTSESGSSLVLVGGADANGYLPPWRWSAGAWTRVPPTDAATLRGKHAMAFDSTHQRAMLFAGFYACVILGDTWGVERQRLEGVLTGGSPSLAAGLERVGKFGTLTLALALPTLTWSATATATWPGSVAHAPDWKRDVEDVSW